MTKSRPEILYPLFGNLTSLAGVGPKVAQNFAGLGVEKPRDLLFVLPHSGIDRRLIDTVKNAVFPAVVTVRIHVLSHKAPRTKSGAYRITVQDSTTTLQLVFFHARGDYLQKILPIGQDRIVSGKVE